MRYGITAKIQTISSHETIFFPVKFVNRNIHLVHKNMDFLPRPSAALLTSSRKIHVMCNFMNGIPQGKRIEMTVVRACTGMFSLLDAFAIHDVAHRVKFIYVGLSWKWDVRQFEKTMRRLLMRKALGISVKRGRNPALPV